ncbi:TadE family type IV pilus minor pilin [Kytococcus sp. Marseille-QA3725]
MTQHRRGRPVRRDPGAGERGFTSVEFAMITPVIVLVLGMAVTAMVLVVDLLQVTDAARVGARAASRGDSGFEVRRQVRALAPDGADVDVRRRGRSVTVTVSSRARGPAEWFPGTDPESSATARLEPGVR